MKVIKRDGRAVDYDRAKIQIAIEKANREVNQAGRASKEDIEGITEYIEELNKKRILVEDIQDIIEEKLMEIKKYELAKKYIVYRYTRALVRKQNTTDETILGIIRNDNLEENIDRDVTPAAQRNYIAGEVSRDLTRRLLLPEKIAKADEEGKIYFHNADYFVHPMIHSSFINIEDMLDNGTVVDGKMVETPKSFLVACTVATQIIATVAVNQSGGLAVDMIHFGKYLRKSYNKLKKQIEEEYQGKLTEEFIEDLVKNRVKSELKAGIQMLQYQLNTLEVVSGKKPQVTLFLHLDKEDEYIKENAMIIEEILKQRYRGIKAESGENVIQDFPKLVYVLDEFNSLKGGEYDYLTRIALKCSINYISAKNMRENYKGNIFCPIGDEHFLSLWKNSEGKYQFEGRFNQGIVSINLPQIALESNGDEESFWKMLNERLELCFEALMCRHYSLVGISSEISPIHWQHGALSRLEKEKRIDGLLYGGYSTLTLGYTGLEDTIKALKNLSIMDKDGCEFGIKIVKHLRETTNKWSKETNIDFVLCAVTSKNVVNRFTKIDKEKYSTIDKKGYTPAFYINSKEKVDLYERLSKENEFQKLSSGGAVSQVDLRGMKQPEVEELIRFIYEKLLHVRLS